MSTIAEPLCVRRPALRRICLRALIARTIVERVLDTVPVRVVYPDGCERGGGGADTPTLVVRRPLALFERMAHNPKIGMAEAYLAGDWVAADGTDLADLLTPFAARVSELVPRPLRRLRAVADRRMPRRQRNTVVGARANISAHYDLSNELFASFLDPSMTYSSAFFAGEPPFTGQGLEAAQRRKVDRILDIAGVTDGTRVLEIGTGWGSLAIAAAQRGADVTSVTISTEQADFAERRVTEAGLSDRVDVRLQDYRDIQGSFDAIVSVEMIEAVGEEFWPAYSTSLDRLLAPGGRIGLQAIVMDHDRLLATRRSYGWVQKYIFPGGLIPSVVAIEQTLGAHTGLQITDRFAFGRHYAETLRRWRTAFGAAWPQLRRLGFDETFRRMWELYLAYSEAGFASGYLDVTQLQLTRSAR